MKLKQLAAATAATALTLPFAAFAADGAAPSAGDLSSMVPDASTILTAVGSVAVSTPTTRAALYPAATPPVTVATCRAPESSPNTLSLAREICDRFRAEPSYVDTAYTAVHASSGSASCEVAMALVEAVIESTSG